MFKYTSALTFACVSLSFVPTFAQEKPAPRPTMNHLTTYPATPAIEIDPKLKARLDAGAKLLDLNIMPPVEGRAEFEKRAAADPRLSEEVAAVVDRTIPGPAGRIPVRVYTPQGPGPFPMVIFYHGGGWVL